MNTARYNKVDDLLASASSEQDPAKRTALYQQVMRKTMEDVPVLPLYADQLFLAHSDKVKGLVQNSLFTVQAYPISLSK
jgi:peptide/nickel transport system substrate-binding protein